MSPDLDVGLWLQLIFFMGYGKVEVLKTTSASPIIGGHKMALDCSAWSAWKLLF